jgi:hypothetical protein
MKWTGVIWTCTRCGQQARSDVDETPIDWVSITHMFDLCPPCVDDLRGFVNGTSVRAFSTEESS